MHRASRWNRGSSILAGLGTLLILLLAACGTGADDGQNATPTEPGGGGERQVNIETTRDLTFEPADIAANVGETVGFGVTDTSGFFHTFTVATGPDKQTILADLTVNGNETKTVSVTLPPEPGQLYVFCRPHEAAGMTGTLTVRGPAI